MSADEFEDYLDSQEPGLKKQIRKSYAEFRRGKARDAKTFLASLQPAGAKREK